MNSLKDREGGDPYPTTGEIDVETGLPIVPTINGKTANQIVLILNKLDNGNYGNIR